MKASWFLTGVLVLAACASPSTPTTAPPSTQGQPVASVPPSRPLVMAIRVEPTSLGARPLQRTGGVTTATLLRLFNAGLAANDQQGVPRAYLAEGLPELNTASWQVLADGRMETSYRLRDGLVWHDGTQLSAEDFVFSWQVYGTPELGAAASLPFNSIEEVTAPDPRTVRIRWLRSFPDAGALRAEDFPPLPRHVMEAAFRTLPSDAFVAQSFWARDYVGSGPYRLTQWEPGAFIEAAAADRHALGAPKIASLRVVWNGDPNAVLATVLAGEVQVVADDSLQSTHASVLRREWGDRNAGTVLLTPTLWRSTGVQLRPELVSPRSLTDVRVRRALAHGIDKASLNESLFEGQGIMADSMVPPTVGYFADVDRIVRKYPYDPRQSEQLMMEAGYAKGADGFYVSGGERFVAEVKTNAGAQYESEMSTMGAIWRQGGFDFREAVNPAALATDGQTRSTFPSLFNASGPLGEDVLRSFNSPNIPRPETRWVGRNRGAWSNAEFDRLVDAFNTTLAAAERNRQVALMTQIFSEELPEIALYFDLGVFAYTAAVQGPQVVAPRGIIAWNIQEWTFR